MKFKVGDRVKLKDNLIIGQQYNGVTFIEKMEKYKGKICTIEIYSERDKVCFLDIDDGNLYYGEDMLELYKDKEFSYKDLLQTGVFGETSNGEVFVVIGNKLVYQNGEFDPINLLNDKLQFKSGRFIYKLVEGCNSFSQYKKNYIKPIFVKKAFTEKELRNYFDIKTLKKLYKEETGIEIEIKE